MQCVRGPGVNALGFGATIFERALDVSGFKPAVARGFEITMVRCGEHDATRFGGKGTRYTEISIGMRFVLVKVLGAQNAIPG